MKDLSRTNKELLEKIAREKASIIPENLKALSPEETWQLLHELKVHQIELEMQNEELRRVQADLEASRARYFDLCNLGPVGYFTLSEQGLILEANLTAATLLGVARGALVKKQLTRFILPEDQDIFYRHRRLLSEMGVQQVYELRMIRKNADPFLASIEMTTVQDTESAPMCYAVVSDITNRKRTEEALKESEKKFRSIAEHSLAGIYLIQDDVLKYVNPKFAEIFGYTIETCMDNMLFRDLVYPEDYVTVKEYVHRQLSGETKFVQYHFRGIKKTSEIIHVEIYGSSIMLNGRPAITGTILDITERESALKKLETSEQRYRHLVDNIAIGVALISPNMEILTLNNQMKSWFPDIDPAKQPQCYRSFNDPPRGGICSYCPTVKTFDDGEVHEDVTMTPAGDKIRNYRIRSSPIKDDKDNVVAAIEMVEDITDRLLTEEQIRLLSQQIMQVQENERQMISYELHDRIAQNLSAMKIISDMACKNPQITTYEFSKTMITHSRLIEETITAVRNLAYELRPPGLEEMGIVKTLEIYCEEFERNNEIRVEFLSAGMQEIAPNTEVAIQIYRLVQEGLNNIKKHADASLATVKLMGAFPYILLRVEDDGKGFDVEAREKTLSKEKRMGLRSMNERTKFLGGRMTIHSSPNEGTLVVIKIPVKEQTLDSEKTNHNY